MVEHLMHDHLGIKHSCEVCGKQFSRQDYYDVHMSMHKDEASKNLQSQIDLTIKKELVESNEDVIMLD